MTAGGQKTPADKPTSSASHPFLAWKTWLVYAGMAVVGIPWYWSGERTELWLGLPPWVWTSVGAAFAASLFTAWLLLKWWPLDEDPS